MPDASQFERTAARATGAARVARREPATRVAARVAVGRGYHAEHRRAIARASVGEWVASVVASISKGNTSWCGSPWKCAWTAARREGYRIVARSQVRRSR